MSRATAPLDTDTDVAQARAAQAPPPIGERLPNLPDLARLAVDVAGVARLLSVSERHVWSLHSSGRLPLPCRVGRRLLWPVDELREWLLANCPPREAWEAQKEQARIAHGAR